MSGDILCGDSVCVSIAIMILTCILKEQTSLAQDVILLPGPQGRREENSLMIHFMSVDV